MKSNPSIFKLSKHADKITFCARDDNDLSIYAMVDHEYVCVWYQFMTATGMKDSGKLGEYNCYVDSKGTEEASFLDIYFPG